MCGEWRKVESVWGEWGGVWESVWEEEVCWQVGKRCGERNGGSVGKCVRVWGLNTFPHLLLHLTFPYISPYFPHTPIYFPTPPSHNSSHTSPSSLHTPTHFHTISTFPLTFSKCGEVTMWRSYWQPHAGGNFSPFCQILLLQSDFLLSIKL